MKKGILDDAMPESIYFCRNGAFLKLSHTWKCFYSVLQIKESKQKTETLYSGSGKLPECVDKDKDFVS